MNYVILEPTLPTTTTRTVAGGRLMMLFNLILLFELGKLISNAYTHARVTCHLEIGRVCIASRP